jgi:uncharacterized protein
MIYVDTSVALAQLMAEDRCPPTEFWESGLVTSRLFEYELWTAIHRRRLQRTHGEAARRMIDSLAMTELSRDVLQRATEPFPSPVRTLDAIHLATLLFLRERGLPMELATYDHRLSDAAKALGVSLADC